MSVGAFIVVQLSSSRLPAKGIMKILEKPMIELMIKRVQHSRRIDKVVITTSQLPSDDPLEELAEQLGVGCYRGALEYVMERISGAAEAFKCDTVVELLGDNPLVHSDLIDDVIDLHTSKECDYTATLTKEYPLSGETFMPFSAGIRVQAYSKNACEKYSEYPDYINNEDKHPCAYIFEHPDTFRLEFLEAVGKWTFLNRPDLNFAVNYKKNFDLVRSVFEMLHPKNANFSLKQVCDLLDRERHLYLQMGL